MATGDLANCDALLPYLPSNSELWPKAVTFVINALLSVTSVTLNSLTIQAIRQTPSLSPTLKTLLLSLAVSDLGVALLGQPMYLAFLAMSIQRVDDHISCLTKFAFLITMGVFISASFFGIMAISLDRFIAIQFPLRYVRLVTCKRVVVVVVFV